MEGELGFFTILFTLNCQRILVYSFFFFLQPITINIDTPPFHWHESFYMLNVLMNRTRNDVQQLDYVSSRHIEYDRNIPFDIH